VVKEVVFAVPGDLATPTGGYAYDRRMIQELGPLGWHTEVIDLGEGFPRPTAAVRAEACARLCALPAGRPIVVDGLAWGVLPEAAAAMDGSHQLVGLVHHPLALESGLTAAEAATLRDSERAALSLARHVVTTSAATARLVTADFGVLPERLTVVEPGTDRVVLPARESGPTVSLLAVGSVVPRKGYDVLVASLATLAELPWLLLIVGDRERDPETARALDADIERLGLTERISFTGAVAPERLSLHYVAADLFVLPSRFEGYGMAFAEAIAHGLPVVGTTAGAIPDTVPAGAGVLVPPDDVDALAAVLLRLIECPHERQRLAEGSRIAASQLPTWQAQAALFASVLEQLA
jgi:glycosyltransferase involved in cell wall biosynthesis